MILTNNQLKVLSAAKRTYGYRNVKVYSAGRNTTRILIRVAMESCTFDFTAEASGVLSPPMVTLRMFSPEVGRGRP